MCLRGRITCSSRTSYRSGHYALGLSIYLPTEAEGLYTCLAVSAGKQALWQCGLRRCCCCRRYLPLLTCVPLAVLYSKTQRITSFVIICASRNHWAVGMFRSDAASPGRGENEASVLRLRSCTGVVLHRPDRPLLRTCSTDSTRPSTASKATLLTSTMYHMRNYAISIPFVVPNTIQALVRIQGIVVCAQLSCSVSCHEPVLPSLLVHPVQHLHFRLFDR